MYRHKRNRPVIDFDLFNTLGYLSNEIVQSTKIISTNDGAAILKNLIAGSSVPIPIDSILVESNVVVPNSLTLVNKNTKCLSISIEFMMPPPRYIL